MIANTLKMMALGAAFSLSTAGSLNASENLGRIDEDRCVPTSDLRISTAKVDIDRKGESEIQGRIINESENKDYKNVRVRIACLNDDGEEIASQSRVIPGTFSDGSSEDFTLKFNAPRGTEDATYYVECAERD